MARDLTYFISDLHLGASYIADPRAHERRIVEFLDSIEPRARALYLLGDIMDYWWDYATVVPRGFVRFLGTLGRLADRGVRIYWFKGNHDIWLFDYFQKELGATVIDGALIADIDGHRFFMEHGDGVGRRSAGFKLIRGLFRNRIAQKCYAAIHPRWTIPLAHAWSSHSRMSATEMPAEQTCAPLVGFAREELSRRPDIDYFVFGHLHCAFEQELGGGKKVIVLGDWIKLMTYAVFDGQKIELKHFTAQK